MIGQDGAFADYLVAPIENLHIVPPGIPDEIAVFTEPLAAALEIQEQARIRPSDRVLLLGAGRLGQLIAQTLALTGCDLQVVARHPGQFELLAAHGIAAIAEDQVESGAMDIVVDATGSPGGFHLAVKAVRPGGTIILKSTFEGEMNLNLSPLVVSEITLVGSRCGPFEPALRLLAQKLLDPTSLITARYPLCDGVAAFEHAAKSGAIKVLLEARPLTAGWL